MDGEIDVRRRSQQNGCGIEHRIKCTRNVSEQCWCRKDRKSREIGTGALLRLLSKWRLEKLYTERLTVVEMGG